MVRRQPSALNLLCVISQGLFRNHRLLSLQAHVGTWLEMILKSLFKVLQTAKCSNKHKCELLVTMSLIPRIPLLSFISVVTHLPGVLSALQRCLLEAPGSVHDTLDRSLTAEVLGLLEKISLLLLGVLYGDLDACATEKGNGAICRENVELWMKSTTFQVCLCESLPS